MRSLAAIALLAFSITMFAASKPLAPDAIAHSNALFLSSLSNDGRRQVTYRAAASGTRFFIEERTGVTVYWFDENGGMYRRQTFLKGYSLAKAMKKYAAVR
jgi:hypothetical protein